jgi:transposase
VRLQTVLHRANGEAANNIARILGIHTNTVSGYVRRYNDGGVGALVRDKTRKPGKAPISVELKNEIRGMACTVKPENAARRGTRSLAKRFKVSRGSVGRILRERGIKPHSVKRFSFSNDPQFVEKLTDVAGLYMNPPDNAIVLCADGKSQIQAL